MIPAIRLLLLGVATLSACALAPTGTVPFAYAGAWAYEAQQEIPGTSAIVGPMYLTRAGDEVFEGTAAWTESLPGGAMRLLSGTLAGVVVQDTILDFTAQVGGVSRRHVGVARGDSVTGTWADGGGATASGRFVARRAGAP